MGSPADIASLLARIFALLKPFEEFPFNPWSSKYEKQWNAAMVNFWNDVENIEFDIRTYIDQAFTNLRSAEGALKMLMNFKCIKSREMINAQLMTKFGNVLEQYDKQVPNQVHVSFFYKSELIYGLLESGLYCAHILIYASTLYIVGNLKVRLTYTVFTAPWQLHV